MSKLPPILVVDDDTDDVFILKRLLGKAGVQNKLITFEDATAALEYLEGESGKPNSPYIPWIVFTDLHMPGVNGIEVTRWIRNRPTLSGVVIAMVTSSEDPKDLAAAGKAGVDDYVLKYPTVSALQQLLERHRPKMKIYPDITPPGLG